MSPLFPLTWLTRFENELEKSSGSQAKAQADPRHAEFALPLKSRSSRSQACLSFGAGQHKVVFYLAPTHFEHLPYLSPMLLLLSLVCLPPLGHLCALCTRRCAAPQTNTQLLCSYLETILAIEVPLYSL